MQPLFSEVVGRNGTRVSGFQPGQAFALVSHETAGAPTHYGPVPGSRFGRVDAGAQVRDFSHLDALWLQTPYSEARITVYQPVGLIFESAPPRVGTTFKGSGPIELAMDGTVSQVSTTVQGTHALTLAQDPRNDPRTVVWVTSHVNLADDQKAPNGKPLPGSGAPRGDAQNGLDDRQFPLLFGQYLPVPAFNAALWAWVEPGQSLRVAPRIYFVKHQFSV
ncbi:MAG: hypothetical protein ACQGVC_17120 [Myxococcota bacterium]